MEREVGAWGMKITKIGEREGEVGERKKRVSEKENK